VLIRVALPLVTLAVLLMGGPWLREYALPLGFLLGNCAVFLLMAREATYSYVPRLSVRKEWERKVFTNSAVVMGSGLIARSRPVIRNYLASLLMPGAIAALSLANRLVEPLERAAFTGLRMLMFSRTVKLFVAQEAKTLGRLYETGLRVSFLLMAPMVWWVALNSEALVRFMFMRGAFDAEMTLLVSLALIGLIPSAVLAGVSQLMSNAFYATDRVMVPALVMPLGTLLYLAIAPPLTAAFDILGLAMTISITSGVDFLIMFVLLPKQVSGFDGFRTARNIALYVGAAGFAFVLANETLRSLNVGDLWRMPLSALGGAAIYLTVLRAVRDSSLERLYQYVQAWGRPQGPAKALR
jgi:putative peptidoglycan lipid II flippase